MKKVPLYIQIIIGLVLGLLFGLGWLALGWTPEPVTDYIKPVGTIFVNGLKMIALPLVIASLIVGVANLGDVTKLSRIGGKTVALYLATTMIAVTVGLVMANVLRPGHRLPPDTRDQLMSLYSESVEQSTGEATVLKDESPLKPIVDIVPENIFAAATSNSAMLQVVFFAIIVGIALLHIPEGKGRPVVAFFDGMNEVIIKIVDFIMFLAPYGVFALIASLIVEIAGTNPDSAYQLLFALLWYAITVLAGLAVITLGVYPTILRLFSRMDFRKFFRGARPAQLMAFSTSSSSATLPVTMKQAENELDVSPEVSSFVLPLGATVNMDGTCLYQAVAAVFIAQALGLNLSVTDQLMIVLTATLASIGSAGVPGAGMVMLVIVLEAIGVPVAGIALIVAPDRILDMCRTVVNITGDLTVSVVVEHSEGKLGTLTPETIGRD